MTGGGGAQVGSELITIFNIVFSSFQSAVSTADRNIFITLVFTFKAFYMPFRPISVTTTCASIGLYPSLGSPNSLFQVFDPSILPSLSRTSCRHFCVWHPVLNLSNWPFRSPRVSPSARLIPLIFNIPTIVT